MGGLKKIPAEGGSGGGRGHSGMEHWAKTAEVKSAARFVRRKSDKRSIAEGLTDTAGAGAASADEVAGAALANDAEGEG